MKTKMIGFLLIGALTLLASLAVACSEDKATAGDDGGSAVVPGGGMIAQNQFLTFDGQRYELVNMLMPGLASADEFSAIGEASQSDVDLSADPRVYSRKGDSDTVYTHSPATAENSELWLAWRLVS